MDVREQIATGVDCAHHWRIASPAGAYSLGTCAKCGCQREFPNSSEVSAFSHGRSKVRSA